MVIAASGRRTYCVGVAQGARGRQTGSEWVVCVSVVGHVGEKRKREKVESAERRARRGKARPGQTE